MKKKMILKKFIFVMLIIALAIPQASYASSSKVPSRKGTVGGQGTKDSPYTLVLGEPIIDIYYKEQGNDLKIYFQFNSSNVGDAANYIVEHNPDKGRLRFKLQDSSPAGLRVSSIAGERYVQAGAANIVIAKTRDGNDNQWLTQELDDMMSDFGQYYQDYVDYGGDMTGVAYDGEVQNPYYEIRSTEELTVGGTTWYHDISLGNGYLMVDNVYAANVSNYSTAYVFAKHQMSGAEAYKYVTPKQMSDKMKISLKPSSNTGELTKMAYFTSPSTLQLLKRDDMTGYYVEDGEPQSIGTVKTTYVFQGTNSAIHHAEDEKDSWISQVVSKFLTSIGDVFSSLTLAAVDKATPSSGSGKNNVLTIDALVFNEYPYTYVAFFDKEGDSKGINGVVRNVINKWYGIFRAWAFIVYVIILIYLGIKAVLYAGTKDQRKVTGLLEGWVMGLLILALYPIFFKYAFMLNDALVDVMRVNSKHSIYAYYSFMDIDGYEEGQDSESSVIDMLMGEAAKLNKRLTQIENLQQSYEDDLAAEQARLQELQDPVKLAQAKSEAEGLFWQAVNTTNLKDTETFTLDGNAITSDQLLNDLWQIMGDYYNNYKQNIDWDDVAFDSERGSFYFDDAFTNELEYRLEDYLKRLNIEGPGSEGRLIDFTRKDFLDAVINQNASPIFDSEGNITGYSRDSLSLYYASTEAMKDAIEQTIAQLQQEHQDIDTQLQNLQNAIVMVENGTPDIMGAVRQKAGTEYKLWENLVWYILLFELIILLALYYKRLFVLACLITIFPLVMIAYVYERATKPESSILKNWTQEYIINVFIQTVHAILYVTLVETSYTVYSDVSDNWLLFVLAVLALITSESVVKHILDLQGSTVKDLTKYSQDAARRAAGAIAFVKSTAGTMKDLENIDNDYKNKLAHDKQKDEKFDEKRDIWRQHQDNKVRGDSSLTEEEKQRKLEEMRKKREAADQKRAKKRAKKAQNRRRAAYAKGVGRVVANATGAMASVAAGFAAGGDPEDFSKSFAAAKAVLGKGQSVALSGEAQKMMDNAKTNTSAEVGNVKQEVANDEGAMPPPTTPPPSSGGYNGSGNYQYVPGSYNNASTVDDEAIESGARPRLQDAFTQRLNEEQVFTQRIRDQRTYYKEERQDREEPPTNG